jgi:hypothetical protein
MTAAAAAGAGWKIGMSVDTPYKDGAGARWRSFGRGDPWTW